MAPRRSKKSKKIIESDTESVGTPLLDAAVKAQLPDIDTPEPYTDAQPVDLTPPAPIVQAPLLRRDATVFEPTDIRRFAEMANNWFRARPYTGRRYPNYRANYSKGSYRVRRPYYRYNTSRPRYMRYGRKRAYYGGQRYRY